MCGCLDDARRLPCLPHNASIEEGSSCHMTGNAMLSLTTGEKALFTVNQIKVFTLPTRLVDLVSNKVEPTSGGGLIKPDYDPG